MKKWIISSLLLLNFITVQAQDSLSNSFTDIDLSNNEFPEPAESSEVLTLPLTNLEFTLSICVLVFGILIILLEMYLVKVNKINSDDTIKFITVTIIIVSTLFLITAGYSNDQIAPATGLLGTIAGYLLGKINTK